MMPTLATLVLVGSMVATGGAASADQARSTAQTLSLTILSTMLTDIEGIGEWGFAAVVEVDGRRWLFDTGARPETVLKNAEELGIDLASIPDVILSHHHIDHTGGLFTLRKALAARNPAALSRMHVAAGMFRSRRSAGEAEGNPMLAMRAEYEATGGRVVEHDGPVELQLGVWLTGPVPRTFPERNWSGSTKVVGPNGLTEDTLPEDQALLVRTPRGLSVVTGCGHAGIANILAYARTLQSDINVRAVVGGLHLFEADESHLAWTAGRMQAAGVTHLLGAHCTGVEAVFRLRALVGLTRATAVVGAVGSGYDDATGIRPGWIAR
ncbi:MAG: MBL fold metallo-hydrolase [Vicinamibacteria bacterium]|nr:MBL fold metallo-hydrolase [Vicinamibacteria bacterium]